MRWSGRLKMGYFPLPLSEAQRIRKFLLFPGQSSSVLDPCVGDGGAFEAITSGAQVFVMASSWMPTVPTRPGNALPK